MEFAKTALHEADNSCLQSILKAGVFFKSRFGLNCQVRKRVEVMSDLKRTILKVRQIILDFHIKSLIPRINTIESMVHEDNIIDVVIVGRFKAGKSSFLNRIIGKDILPVAVLPTTAVITRIFHGTHERITVRYLNGSEEESPLEKLNEYVTEQMNPKNEKSVGIVDVELPELEEIRCIRFVDTPGLGSVFTHNTEISMNWLPRIGAAILTISIDHPLSEQDIELLRELTKHTPDTVILLTKIDLVTEQQLEEVLHFLNTQIKNQIGVKLPIFPFSTRTEYALSREKFINQYLVQQIVERNTEMQLRILKHKIGFLIAETGAYLDLAHNAANAAEQARSELIKQIHAERAEFQAVQNEILILTIDMKTKLREMAMRKFLSHYTEIIRRMRSDFQEKSKTWRGNLSIVTGLFQQWLKLSLIDEMGRISPGEGMAIMESLNTSSSAFQRLVRAFQDRMAFNIKQALQMSFNGARFEINIEQPQKPDVKIDRIFDTPFDMIWFLIPMIIFRHLFIGYFMRSLPWEIEKNLHRTSVQWADAICNSIDEMARSSSEFIRNELNTIEGLVSDRDNQLDAIQKSLLELESLEKTLCEF